MDAYRTPSLISTMDGLWFHHTVLLSDSFSMSSPRRLKPVQNIPVHLLSISLPALREEERSTFTLEEEGISSNSSSTILEDKSNKEEEETEISQNEGPPILKLRNSDSCSYLSASSKSFPKYQKNSRNSIAMRRMRKSMSCKSLEDLELEEVKGFIDMGFVFEEENLTPRMMSVVPGLQRINLDKNENSPKIKAMKSDKEDPRETARPYLSEAWLVKRTDSINLRVLKLSASADIKKHIKVWAKSVASAVQQVS